MKELNTTLIAISPQLVGLNRELIENKKLNFEILRDPVNDVAADYGLRWVVPQDLKQLYLKFGIDLAASNGDDSWTLPMPARFVLDSRGVVVSANADPDYTRRPEPQVTMEELRRLAE